MSLGILHIVAMWEAKETSMIREQEKKKTGFRVHCRFLSEVLSLSVPHFWMPRYQEIAHWWESWKCARWTLSPARKTNKQKKRLPVSSLPGLSYQHASPSKSVKYQIFAVLPKVSWIEALVLMFGDLWAAAKAVSLCKTCDTVTGGHCQAARLSQRVLCFEDRNWNSEWEHIFTGELDTLVSCVLRV